MHRRELAMEERSKLSQVLINFRAEQHWSQKELARALGMCPQRISQLEVIPKIKDTRTINPVYYRRLKDIGLDLKDKIPDINITRSRRNVVKISEPENIPLRTVTKETIKDTIESIKSVVKYFDDSMIFNQKQVNTYQAQINEIKQMKEEFSQAIIEVLTKPLSENI